MRLERTFLLSLYLTLGLACACMSYAVQPYLPELAYLTWAVIALLALAFWVEGRWSLSNLAANLAAVIIAAAAGLWVAYRLSQPSVGRVDLAILSAPMLPHLGALLIVLMVVKLFRSKKVGDFWWLYAIAFMAVALACVLDSEAWFGILLVGYLACGIWSLSLFYLYRGLPAAEAVAVPWPALGLRLAVRRALLVAGIGFALFLITPRLVSTPWPGNPLRMQTGLAEPGIDLNRTGTIQLNTEVAFSLEARDRAGNIKLDLDPDQRFRGMTLNSYSRGCWAYRSNLHAGGAQRGPRKGTGLPDLGPDQYSLTYTYTYRPQHRLVLAEPIALPDDPRGVPVVSLTEENQHIPWLRQPTGELLPPLLPRGPCRYIQVTRPLRDQDQPPVRLEDDQIELLCRTGNLPGLADWTAEILQQMAEGGQIPKDDLRRREDGAYSARSFERLAHALESYLATSGQYTYSLELPRQDSDIDPVLDFLWNVKRGHCQRFASALALMLRSQGIPCRIVIGFRGAEHLGDGNYVVRHSQAHAWVEALAVRADGQFYWLTLDATPAADLGESSYSLVRWWSHVVTGSDSFWRNFVLDYHADRQAATLELWDTAVTIRLGGWLLIGSILVGVFLLIRRWRRRRRGDSSSLASVDPLYGQLLQVLARRCQLVPLPAQTPLEFAAVAGRHLNQSAFSSPLVDVPTRIARLYYRYRYGGQPIPEQERDLARGQIDELDRLLARPVANGKLVG